MHGQAGQATPSVVAAVSVVVIAAALVAFFAGGSADDAATTPRAQPQSATGPAHTATATPTPTAKPTSTPGAQRQQRSDKRSDKHQRQRRDDRRQTPEPRTGPPDVYVEVYNNSSISGLAASTAARLQDGGWQVVGVDNWYGDIPASTVYYPDGMAAEADELADTLGIGRVRGAVEPMKFDRLTVILTPDAA